MHCVRINPTKNRMYIFLNDGDTGDTKSYVDAIENACENLASSFSCVAVLDKQEIIRQSDIDLLFKTMDLIYAYGAGRIILVRKNNGKSDFFQPNPLNFRTCFTIENATNIQEAENRLDHRPAAYA